jgi:Amidohydrolase family
MAYIKVFPGACFKMLALTVSASRTHAASRGLEPGTAPWMRAVTATIDVTEAESEAKGKWGHCNQAECGLACTTRRCHYLGGASPADVGLNPSARFRPLTRLQRTDLTHWQMSPALESVFAAMKQRDIILDATIDVGYRGPVPNWPAALAPLLAKEAYRRGIKISAGTDDDTDWDDPNSALLTEIGRLVHDAGLSTADALLSANVTGTQTVGQQDTAGILAEGRVANFVVLRASPLADIHNLFGVVLMVEHGKSHARDEYKPVAARTMAISAR